MEDEGWIDHDDGSVNPQNTQFSSDESETSTFKFLDNFTIEEHLLADKTDNTKRKNGVVVQNLIGDFAIEESSQSWKEEKKTTKKKEKKPKKRQNDDPKEKEKRKVQKFRVEEDANNADTSPPNLQHLILHHPSSASPPRILLPDDAPSYLLPPLAMNERTSEYVPFTDPSNTEHLYSYPMSVGAFSVRPMAQLYIPPEQLQEVSFALIIDPSLRCTIPTAAIYNGSMHPLQAQQLYGAQQQPPSPPINPANDKQKWEGLLKSTPPVGRTRAKWWWLLQAERNKVVENEDQAEEQQQPSPFLQHSTVPEFDAPSSSNSPPAYTSPNNSPVLTPQQKLPPRSKLKDLLQWVQNQNVKPKIEVNL